MKTVTWYAEQENVGRRTAMLNVAWELATRGKKVMLLDMDISTVPLTRLAKARLKKEDGKWVPAPLCPGLYGLIYEYIANDNKFPSGWGIDFMVRDLGPRNNLGLMPAGSLPYLYAGYEEMESLFSWRVFYPRYYGGSFMLGIMKVLSEVEVFRYDYLFVEACGIGDFSVITTMQIPDTVVLVTSFTESEGVHHIERLKDLNRRCRGENGCGYRLIGKERQPIRLLTVESLATGIHQESKPVANIGFCPGFHDEAYKYGDIVFQWSENRKWLPLMQQFRDLSDCIESE